MESIGTVSLLPGEVALDDADAKALKKLTAETEAFNTFLETILNAGQQRQAQLQQHGRMVFQGLAAKYGLDLKRVRYVPNDDCTKLVPVQMVLGNAAVSAQSE